MAPWARDPRDIFRRRCDRPVGEGLGKCHDARLRVAHGRDFAAATGHHPPRHRANGGGGHRAVLRNRNNIKQYGELLSHIYIYYIILYCIVLYCIIL